MKNPLFTLHEVDKSQIRFEAERLKIALSSRSESTVILQNIEVEDYGFKNIEIPIDRDLFRKITDNINKRVEKCIKRVLEMDDHEGERLRDYGLDYILLAGQGSKLFTIREVIERLIVERFEKKLSIIESHQESAVVYGLCTYTGVLRGFQKNLLLIDTNYRGIGIKCKEILDEKGEGPDFIISPKENENTKTYELLQLNTTIPTFISRRTAAWEKLEGKITLPIKFVEIDPEKGKNSESFIGKVDIEVQGNAKPLTIYLDCDANRTIVVSIANPTNKNIENYQLNNFYYPVEDIKLRSLITQHEFEVEKTKRI
jgi:molecular chaperone DnaK (HSP70)